MTLTYSGVTGGNSAFRIEDFVFCFGVGRAIHVRGTSASCYGGIRFVFLHSALPHFQHYAEVSVGIDLL